MALQAGPQCWHEAGGAAETAQWLLGLQRAAQCAGTKGSVDPGRKLLPPPRPQVFTDYFANEAGGPLQYLT